MLVNYKALNPDGERLYCYCGDDGCDTCQPWLFYGDDYDMTDTGDYTGR